MLAAKVGKHVLQRVRILSCRHRHLIVQQNPDPFFVLKTVPGHVHPQRYRASCFLDRNSQSFSKIVSKLKDARIFEIGHRSTFLPEKIDHLHGSTSLKSCVDVELHSIYVLVLQRCVDFAEFCRADDKSKFLLRYVGLHPKLMILFL